MKFNWRLLFAALTFVFLFACDDNEQREQVSESQDSLLCEDGVGLGLYFMNGTWNPDMSPLPDPTRPTTLDVVRGTPRYLEEVYVASFLPTTIDDGITPVVETGDFSGLDWSGLTEEPVDDWRLESNGFTYQHQVFYKGAAWMEQPSRITVRVKNAQGTTTSILTTRLGGDNEWKATDDFGERRLVARVVSTGCVAEGDCSNPEAQHFAEALVQLRVSLHANNTVSFTSQSSSLDMTWSAYPGHTWQVPVTTAAETSSLGYGFQLELSEVNPPSRGFYLPGEQVSVRMTYKDAQGNPLFSQGSMPSYAEMITRQPSAKGLRYLTFNGFPMLYWAHKPLQGAMQTFLAGPVNKMTVVGTTPITPFSLFMPEIPAATHAVDGYDSLIQETPITPVMFSCLLGIDPSLCAVPTSDVFTYTVPVDAESGTWVAGAKARREWMGEPSTTAAFIKVQVGTTSKTYFTGFPVAGLSPCISCHTGEMAIPRSGHGFPNVNAVGPQCIACHTDGYYFEPDAGITTRLTYLHAQSDRLTPP